MSKRKFGSINCGAVYGTGGGTAYVSPIRVALWGEPLNFGANGIAPLTSEPTTCDYNFSVNVSGGGQTWTPEYILEEQISLPSGFGICYNLVGTLEFFVNYKKNYTNFNLTSSQLSSYTLFTGDYLMLDPLGELTLDIESTESETKTFKTVLGLVY